RLPRTGPPGQGSRVLGPGRPHRPDEPAARGEILPALSGVWVRPAPGGIALALPDRGPLCHGTRSDTPWVGVFSTALRRVDVQGAGGRWVSRICAVLRSTKTDVLERINRYELG